MSKETKKVFSNELIEFSKLIDGSFDNISKDIIELKTNSEKANKVSTTEINKLKKDLVELKGILNGFKQNISLIDKKVKKRNVVDEPKVINNKDSIKELKTELSDIKVYIKRIEDKLKMN